MDQENQDVSVPNRQEVAAAMGPGPMDQENATA